MNLKQELNISENAVLLLRTMLNSSMVRGGSMLFFKLFLKCLFSYLFISIFLSNLSKFLSFYILLKFLKTNNYI